MRVCQNHLGLIGRAVLLLLLLHLGPCALIDAGFEMTREKSKIDKKKKKCLKYNKSRESSAVREWNSFTSLAAAEPKVESYILLYSQQQSSVLFPPRNTPRSFMPETLCNYISIEKYLILYSDRRKKNVFILLRRRQFFPHCHSLIGF